MDNVKIDLSRLRRYSLYGRPSKERLANLAPLDDPPTAFRALNAAEERHTGFAIDRLAVKMTGARKTGRGVVWATGAHSVKLGLSPIIVDLMKRGFITGVAVNGAFVIHEIEFALAGGTSEDVKERLPKGEFGFARETAVHFARAALRAAGNDIGLGRAAGLEIIDCGRTAYQSVLAAGVELDIPVTVHVAIGTDIVCMHPEFPAAAVGEATHRDFLNLAAQVERLEGGVFVNAGSAVILPEVFLKAASIAANLGRNLASIATAVIDQVRHYRPEKNVLERHGGDSIFIGGRLERILPLLRWAVLTEASS